ncbi:MAG TPA: alpha-glucan family phosphorylase [Chitinophagaceae bacterium]|nr:alpha-glucan family phosphorylase [Chitinophagaceae bacterium]
MAFQFTFPYEVSPEYGRRVAYFSMEFGIHQPLKTYAGGLGFLAGSHVRSAFELKQNLVGIGILWKYGYYTQTRKPDQSMDVLFEENVYGFLEKTDIRFTISVSRHDVWVTAYYLPPTVFNSAPVFFLSTDLPENDYLARTISHKLYDANPETKIASAILLGAGGARLLEALDWVPEVYHLNESHGLPLGFFLYNKFRNLSEVRRRLFFTNHTPEASGNQQSNISLLDNMGFFCDIPVTEVRAITGTEGDLLDYTLSALRLSGAANGVSRIHRETLCNMWAEKGNVCKLISVTNAQNFAYWHNPGLYQALAEKDDARMRAVKLQEKKNLFEEVADQCGEIYDEKVCTIVFAKRFAGYKRADLLLRNMERFEALVTNKDRPVQIIWAGKPYPMDYSAIGVFDKIVHLCKTYSNCSILVGYELRLSRLLKRGADVWLNVPRLLHEASGTSGMAAAMNGAVNLGTADGWFPEFARDKINSFVIPACDTSLPDHIQDDQDAGHLLDLLENEVLPMYYDYPDRWWEIVKSALTDVVPMFDSKRMVREYYQNLYREY